MAVEDLFGKGFLSFDMNPKSRGAPTSTATATASSIVMSESNIQEGSEGESESETSASFSTKSDYKNLDDLVNLINALRFLCVHKWSALGDSFLACSSVVGSPNQMQKSMLSTRQSNIYWNEEWLD